MDSSPQTSFPCFKPIDQFSAKKHSENFPSIIQSTYAPYNGARLEYTLCQSINQSITEAYYIPLTEKGLFRLFLVESSNFPATRFDDSGDRVDALTADKLGNTPAELRADDKAGDLMDGESTDDSKLTRDGFRADPSTEVGSSISPEISTAAENKFVNLPRGLWKFGLMGWRKRFSPGRRSLDNGAGAKWFSAGFPSDSVLCWSEEVVTCCAWDSRERRTSVAKTSSAGIPEILQGSRGGKFACCCWDSSGRRQGWCPLSGRGKGLVGRAGQNALGEHFCADLTIRNAQGNTTKVKNKTSWKSNVLEVDFLTLESVKCICN